MSNIRAVDLTLVDVTDDVDRLREREKKSQRRISHEREKSFGFLGIGCLRIFVEDYIGK